jgi:hypothetical protein
MLYMSRLYKSFAFRAHLDRSNSNSNINNTITNLPQKSTIVEQNLRVLFIGMSYVFPWTLFFPDSET